MVSNWNLLVSECVVAVVASGLVSTAQAQDKVDVPTAAPAKTASSLDEIVVTARRHAELLQDVPISMVALSADTLKRSGVLRTEDLQLTTPTLRIIPQSNGRNSPVFELRAINTFDVLATQDPAIAVYINEVYLARPIGVNQPLVDMESVQVLLGPQGTLFGRNSTAGAILFTSKKPTDKFEGEVGVNIGNYNRLDYNGVVNIPVTDRFALRLVAQRIKRDGYTKDIVTGKRYDDEDTWSGRISARWEPVDGIKNDTVFDYFKADENGTTTIVDSARPGGTISTLFPGYQAYLAAQKARGPREVTYDFIPRNNAIAYGLSNITSIEQSENLTIKNIFGYRRGDAVNVFDIDSSPFSALGTYVRNYGHQYTDELQAQGKALDGALDYIAGAYYFKEHSAYHAESDQRTSAAPIRRSITNTFAQNQSESLFGQVTYRPALVKGLSFTGGVRYTWDKRQVTYDNPTLNNVGAPLVCAIAFIAAGQPCVFSNSKNFAQPSWTIGADYKLTADKLLYIVSRRGYRSGGFASRAVSIGQTVSFDPETVTDLEVGFKGDWHLSHDAVLRTNLAVYRSDYDDIQRNVSSLINGISTSTIINAAKARINGFELNTTLRLAKQFEVSAYWGYADAIHTKFNALVGGVPTTLTNVPFGVPKQTYGASVTVTPMDNADGRLSFTATASYVGPGQSTQALPFLEPEGAYPGYRVVNLSGEWRDVLGSPFTAQLWVRNLLNKDYIVSSQSLQSSFGFTAVTYGAPRMVGLNLTYKFGEK